MSRNCTTAVVSISLLMALLFAASAFFAVPSQNIGATSDSGSFSASEAETRTVNFQSPTQPDDSIHFLVAQNCAFCHSSSNRANAMRDAKRRPVAPYDLWQASMMANSARDPYWRAVLSAEVVATPSKKALIEEKCTRCHAPMAAPAPESPPGEVLAYLKRSDQRSFLGLDGVSCTVCHQITDKGLGSDETFTGNSKSTRNPRSLAPTLIRLRCRCSGMLVTRRLMAHTF